MKPLYPPKLQQTVDALQQSQGATAPALRRALADRAASLGGASRPEGDIPADVVGYVDKVALHAYRVTDDDIDALKQAGYSEDAIFEVTLSAAVGAGLARMDIGLDALKRSR